jgi:CRISPR-associated protein Cas1
MYAKRLGEVLPHRAIDVLRGIEGARAKMMYRLLAEQYGIEWHGRNFDRTNPSQDDLPNQAINHAAATVQAAAALAVQSVGALPQLGFIHEDSGQSFVLDIADLFRDQITLPIAFSVAKKPIEGNDQTIDRQIRRQASQMFRQKSVIPAMITAIKDLLQLEDKHGNDNYCGKQR